MAGVVAPTSSAAPSPGGGTGVSAPAPSPASPAAVQRAARPNDNDADIDPRAAASAAVAERKNARLRLVADDTEADPDAVDAIVEDADDDGRDAGDDADDDGEAEPEQVPTWAQKLKTENEAHKATIAEHVEREQTWTGEVQRIRAAHEDLTADVAHYKGLYESCAKFLGQLKTKDGRPMLDPREIELAEQRRRNGSLDRQLKRGGTAKADDGAKKAGADIAARFDAYRKKHHEMDWTKNPEAKAWLSELLAHPLPPYLDRLVDDFVSSQRFKRAQKKPAPAKQPPRPNAPDNNSPAGAPSGGTPRRAAPRDDGYDRSAIKSEIAQRRASRVG